MSIVAGVKKAGIALATAGGIYVGFGASQALADCTVVVSAANGRTLDGQNQAVGGVKRITNQMASGPKQSWEICSRYGEQWLAAAKPYGAVAMRVKMDCSGSWRGEWCKDVSRGPVTVNFSNFKNYAGFFGGDGIAAFTRAANENRGRRSDVETVPTRRTVVEADATVTTSRRRTAEVEVETQGRTLVRRRVDGWSEFKCGC